MKLNVQARSVFLASIFLVFTARILALNLNQNLDQNANCGGTEVCLLRLEDQALEIPCNCNSTRCWWTKFANRDHIISNKFLTLQSREDYGQYICYEDNVTVVMDILILPEGG